MIAFCEVSQIDGVAGISGGRNIDGVTVRLFRMMPTLRPEKM